MATTKTQQAWSKNGPSTFALLVDDINKMSESEQKLLWMDINHGKISSLAKEIDYSANPHNLSAKEIDALVTEARKNGSKRKKG